jgi:hypothetical protein
MSRSISISILAGLMLLLAANPAHAQQPLGIISIEWNNESPDAPRRNPEVIYKALKAAFADTLKKKLNVTDPATIADVEPMHVDARSIQLAIISRGAAQPTADEILAAVKDSYVETVTNFFNDFHAREVAQLRDGPGAPPRRRGSRQAGLTAKPPSRDHSSRGCLPRDAARRNHASGG